MFAILREYYSFFIFLSFSLLACDGSLFGPGQPNATIKFKGENYEMFNPIPMAFNKDTIYPELWFRTLNVDGDNKRIMRFFSKGDTTIFSLPNSVNNYTDVDCYSLQVSSNRYLWIEDNFGTTVFDIDKRKIVKVHNATKELTEITPTGSPIGLKHQVNKSDMKRRLRMKANGKILILDSLTFKM